MAPLVKCYTVGPDQITISESNYILLELIYLKTYFIGAIGYKNDLVHIFLLFENNFVFWLSTRFQVTQ